MRIDQLKKENEQLRRQLDYTLSVAKANESLWRHLFEIERILFRTRHLEQLIEELLEEIKLRFQLDHVVLFLAHPDVQDRFFPRITDDYVESISEGTWILPFSASMGEAFFGQGLRPAFLSSEAFEELGASFPEELFRMESGVLIPLGIHRILFGALLLGSEDPDRYRNGDATDMLEQLGAKIALCMDNCLTYEKLKDFAGQSPDTFLLNFFQIHSALENEFWKAQSQGTPLSVLIIGLDFYKEAADVPQVVPDVLQHVAGLLEGVFSEDDVYVGRYGSNEFMLLLPGVSERTARQVAAYLSQEIRKSPLSRGNTAILIQAVIGVAAYNERMRRSYDLVDSACMELHRLKVDGAVPGDGDR